MSELSKGEGCVLHGGVTSLHTLPCRGGTTQDKDLDRSKQEAQRRLDKFAG